MALQELSGFNNISIPYNSQFLIIKNILNEENNYLVEEIYHPMLSKNITFNQNFGIWNKNTGLKVFEPDFYKRRLNLNNTGLYAIIRVNINKFSPFHNFWFLSYIFIYCRKNFQLKLHHHLPE